MNKKQTFEKAMEKLEQIVADLESGDHSLDVAIKKFEEGIKLSKFCSEKLDDMEKRISVLLVMAGGKRLRPILCIAAAEAIGGDCPAAVLPAACALEMIHTYSLIHDDLPAMDNDSLRRGKPTCHKAYDEATAILAGDALLTMAFEILAAPGDAAVAPSVRLAAIQVMARAAGYSGMIEGQIQDIHSWRIC